MELVVPSDAGRRARVGVLDRAGVRDAGDDDAFDTGHARMRWRVNGEVGGAEPQQGTRSSSRGIALLRNHIGRKGA